MSSTSLELKAMPSKPNSKVDFRDLELKNQINARYPDKSEGLMAKRDLKRYYTFLEVELQSLKLSFEEARAIVYAFEGRKFDDEANLLPIQREIIGAIQLEQVKFSPLQVDVFIRKVKGWEHDQLLALTDAVERFWYSKTVNSSVSDLELLRRMGVIPK